MTVHSELSSVYMSTTGSFKFDLCTMLINSFVIMIFLVMLFIVTFSGKYMIINYFDCKRNLIQLLKYKYGIIKISYSYIENTNQMNHHMILRLISIELWKFIIDIIVFFYKIIDKNFHILFLTFS